MAEVITAEEAAYLRATIRDLRQQLARQVEMRQAAERQCECVRSWWLTGESDLAELRGEHIGLMERIMDGKPEPEPCADCMGYGWREYEGDEIEDCRSCDSTGIASEPDADKEQD